MTGTEVRLSQVWTVGDRIGGGGFGQVYEGTSNGEVAALKFVPKAPGADRELLFVDLGDVRNVVPILDSGEHEGYWVLVMPRAETSLRQLLEQSQEPLTPDLTLVVLNDVADALVDLEGRVVHRDIKPENVLRLGDRWCLADFGISRYAESTTAPDTHKFSLSPSYAAPERWRNERASSAADIYALGVMAFEMLTGRRPFRGRTLEQLREEHLHSEPPSLEGVPVSLAAVVEECLYKASEARPAPANLKARLERLAQPPASVGLAKLQEANRAEVARRGEEARRASAARTESERRSALANAAMRNFARISGSLRDAIEEAAPSAAAKPQGSAGWTIRLNRATIELSDARPANSNGWGGWDSPAFDVIATASLRISIPETRFHYTGRSHSLWYCDAAKAGQYAWYETAFMITPLRPLRSPENPFAKELGEDAAKALWPGLAEYQVAWPFTELVVGDLHEFVDRWAGWFAAGAEGLLEQPSTMPERPAEGSWRRS